jgi:hydrogenase nickel incorporation protein HypA/HybF
MHELGLCQSIVDAVESRAGDRPVAKIRVRVGRLQHVLPEAFDQSFAMAASGTVADGATAELVFLPVTGRCLTCGDEFEGQDEVTAPLSVCPKCGGVDIEMTGGNELLLESIEYRMPAPAREG